jgi:hypothetical protein
VCEGGGEKGGPTSGQWGSIGCAHAFIKALSDEGKMTRVLKCLLTSNWSCNRPGDRHVCMCGCVCCLKVIAVAYDNPIPGYATPTTSNLRLWDAEAPEEFDLTAFNAGDYDKVGGGCTARTACTALVLLGGLGRQDCHAAHPFVLST